MQDTEGYNCCFIEFPPTDLVCKICLGVSCDAQQANGCCGSNFCRECLKKYMESTVIDKDTCPFCRQPSFAFVPDLRAQRQIFNLQVYCPNKQLGCMWTGELRAVEKHLDKPVSSSIKGCPFTEVHCSNNCGLVIQRRLLDSHLKSDCKLRNVNCDYCGITGTYQWITGDHHQEDCHKYLVECPHHCEIGSIRREDMKRHLGECPLAIVECPFSILGCKSIVRRDQELEHLKQATEQHTVCNKNGVVSIQNELTGVKQLLELKTQQLNETQITLRDTLERLSATQDELNSVKQELKDVKKELHSRIEGNELKLQQFQTQFEDMKQVLMSSASSTDQFPIDYDSIKTGILLIKVSDFEKQCEGWYSQSFYTSEQGYKMCLYLNLGGIGRGRGTHISIAAFLMKGDNDDSLSWPIKGSLHVQLLNHVADNNHVHMILKFGSGTYSKRVHSGTKSFSGCYCDRLIAHSCLEYSTDDNTQYLKDDCIFCNVLKFVPA